MFTTREEIEAYFNQEKLTCLECGKKFNALPLHLIKTHQMEVRDYKIKYGLPQTRGLNGTITRKLRLDDMAKRKAEGRSLHDSCDWEKCKRERDKWKERIKKKPKGNKIPRPNFSAIENGKRFIKLKGVEEPYSEEQMTEFLNRMKSGRSFTSVTRDKDMPKNHHYIINSIFPRYPELNKEFVEFYGKNKLKGKGKRTY